MMARASRTARLDTPGTRGVSRTQTPSRDRFGRFTEWVARAMGTPTFLTILTLFCALWIGYTMLAEQNGWWRFDSAALGFTALTLMMTSTTPPRQTKLLPETQVDLRPYQGWRSQKSGTH